jgi:hypothetical protein
MWHAWGRGEVFAEFRLEGQAKRLLGIPMRRWEDNITMDLREIGIEVANWIRLILDMVQSLAFVNTVMNLLVP